MADQKGEVELLQKSLGNVGRIVWLRQGVVRVSVILDGLRVLGRCNVDFDVPFAVALTVRANSTFVVDQRRSNG